MQLFWDVEMREAMQMQRYLALWGVLYSLSTCDVCQDVKGCLLDSSW